MRMRNFLLLLFSCFAIITNAQTGVIRGTVYDDETGEGVLFTTVQLKGTNYGATSNTEGIYQISKVPAGTYIIIINNVDYSPYEKEITIKNGQILQHDIYLEKGDAEELKVFKVVDKSDKNERINISVTPATKKDFEAVPLVGGTKDFVNYVTAAVPGAITTGDQGGQVYIRGGSPIQNKVLLDGMIVYNPFHSIGFFSVFDTDLISSADIHTGGFNAQFGGRISSIMDVKMRTGNKNEFKGNLEANPFGSKLTLEGPLWNNLKEGGSAGTYVLSAKRSYLSQTSKLIYPYVNGDEGLPFDFTDLYGKFSTSGNTGSKFSVFGFSFNDQVNYQAISDLSWNSFGVGSKFTLVPVGNPVLIEGNISYSSYRIGLQEENLPERFSKIGGMNGGFDFTYFLGKSEIKYGIKLDLFRTEFSTFNEANRKIEQNENTSDISIYTKYRWVKPRFVLEPGLRLQYYASIRKLSPEPRLGLKYNMAENTRLKVAAGMYSQNLIQANSDRDVVNLFYGFLSGPQNLQSEIVNEDGSTSEVRNGLQRANHLIVGIEQDLGESFSINVEGYVKDFTQLTNINRNKIYDISETDKPEVLRNDYIVETGLAKGVDVVFKYKTDSIYFWVVYSLGKVDRWDGLISYAPVFDRRHNVNVVAAYKFGKDKLWDLNGRWNYGSGFPFTQTQGVYQPIDFGQGISTDIINQNATTPELLYGDLNNGRLPDYHRMDLTLSRSFRFFKMIEGKKEGQKPRKKIVSELKANIGCTNIYSRKNVFYVNRLTGEVVRQLPIMPSVGFNWSF